MSHYILGVSAYYHDSGAALLCDGEIVAAAQEERFTRKKHDSNFPKEAIKYCLQEAQIDISEVQDLVFYDKPLLKFDRLVETYLNFAPKGFASFCMAMPIWLKEKLFLKSIIKDEVKAIFELKKEDKIPKLFFTEHHQSHAASAYFASPYEDAAVLTLDGVGEWATASGWHGKGNDLNSIWQINFPHSLGLLYSAFTYFCGFKVNSGEYKLMGLAPYGKPKYTDLIKEHLIDIKPDGSFRLDQKYFNYATGLRMTNDKFAKLFSLKRRSPETPMRQEYMDLARSVQEVTEEVVLKLAKTMKAKTGSKNLCLAGGVALNCVANGKIKKQKIFENIWVQPAAGDAGGSLGGALALWHQFYNKPKANEDIMKGAYLGPRFSELDVSMQLDKLGAVYEKLELNDTLSKTAQLLSQENVVGWFNGRMEFGPRALGARSILGDPRSEKMQSQLNLKIKYRESFRPFAPSVLAEDVEQYFDYQGESPYMLMVADVQNSIRKPLSEEQKKLFGIELLNIPKSEIPAITHVDYSARLQTVHKETNEKYYYLIKEFKNLTGCSVIVNTSFNVRGEPIVCTPLDAYKCFMRTEMDYLVIENCLFEKTKQPNFEDKEKWQEKFLLD